MQTAVFLDIQRRHAEQSKWTDIRAYAAEMLRRHEAKNPKQSKRSSSSQRKSASRKTNNAKQQARRSVPNASAPVSTNEKIQQANPISNDIAYQQLEQIILQGNTINHGIPVNDVTKSMPVPSHVPNAMAPTVINNSSLYETRENDGQGLDEACFQELFAAVKTGLRIISQPNAAVASPGPVNADPISYANYHGRGIITRGSLSAGSQISSNENQAYLSSCLEAMGTEDGTSLAQRLAVLNMTAANGKLNAKPRGSRPTVKVGNKSSKQVSHGISDGVCKKGKPTKKVGTLKKKDFICPYDDCGKAFERRYNLKVHTRRHTGEMPYTCPKTKDGCFLYFRWRSSLRHHLKTVHNDVVPISQNNSRGTASATPVMQTANMLSGQNNSSVSGLPAGTSSAQSSGSSMAGVFKNGRIRKASTKKQSKARKNFPAVAVRLPTAQELAQLGVAALSKSTSQATPVYVPEMSPQARNGVITQKNIVQAAGCISPVVQKDLIDISSFLATEDEMSMSPSSSNDEGDIFEGMDFDVPDYLALPKLCDLPAPEEFFSGA